MQRIVNLVRRPRATLWFCRRYATEADIEEKFFQKGPIDPSAVSLMDKFESDIVYSSYVENNKKPLSYKHRQILDDMCEKHKRRAMYEEAMRKPFSLALKYSSKGLTDAAPNVPAKPIVSMKDTIPVAIDKLKEERDTSRQIMLNESKLEIIRQMRARNTELEDAKPKYPEKWMQDYETFDEIEDDEFTADSEYGTPDPSIPITKIPCHGCGALLQCADTGLPGYLPSELLRYQTDEMLRTLICQRCHFLKNYNLALQLKVDPDEYVKMISSIQDKFALAVLMVDLVDFPCSIWPQIVDIIGPKRPVFIVGNKVDLLPQDSKRYLQHIKTCLEQSLIDSGFAANNIKHTCLISAETNYGVEDMITSLHDIWGPKGDVYLVGCTNVGKSTLFNALLRSDYCKAKASNLIRRATASIWPGTTLRMLKFPILRPSYLRMYERNRRLHSERRQFKEQLRLKREHVYTGSTPQTTLMGHIRQTFSPHRVETSDPFRLGSQGTDFFISEQHKDYIDSKWLYDTPGVVQNDQIINLLTTDELLDVIPKKVLWPRVLLIKPGYSLFLAGLGRVDFIGGTEHLRLSVYASDRLPLMLVDTMKADQVYRECVGSKLMSVPRGDAKRMAKWPTMQRCENKISVSGYESEKISVCDIVLSSAGWVSVNLPRTETASFYAWTPERRGIYVRKPALLPYGTMEYCGERIGNTPAYSLRLPTSLAF